MATAEVEVTENSAKSNIFIANFTNGKLVNQDGVQFALVEDQKGRKRCFISETEKLTYIGGDAGSLCPRTNQYSKYMVAVYDKTTGKVKLADAQMFNIRPELQDSDIQEEDEELNFMEKLDTLTSSFGGSKSKKIMMARKRNQISGKTLEEAVSGAAKEALSNPLSHTEPLQEDEVGSLIPPHNLDATHWKDAYPLEGLISSSIHQACKVPARGFVEATRENVFTWITEKKYPQYILDHVLRLPIDPDARLDKAAYLMYLHYLMCMYKLKASDLRRKEFLPREIPQEVKKELLQSFAVKAPDMKQKGRYYTPARLKDKLLSYILILSLNLDENSLEFHVLLPDVKLTIARLRQHMRFLGVGIKQMKEKCPTGGPSKTVNRAFISLPLTFRTEKIPPKSNRR